MLRYTRSIRTGAFTAQSRVRSYRIKRTPLDSISHIPGILNKTIADTNEPEKTLVLKGETPEEVERNLISSKKFQEINPIDTIQETFIQYLKFFNGNKFKKSSKNLSNLTKSLESKESNSISKIRAIFDYLLEECDLEIKRSSTTSPSQVFDEEEKYGDDLEESIMNEIFQSAQEQTKSLEGSIGLKSTSFLLEILKSFNERYNDVIKPKQSVTEMITFDQLAQAFEVVKLIPNEQIKQKGIYLVGNLLYGTGKVRLDPINESFYIESLLTFGHYKKAYNLFITNKDKVHERWWNELGLMITLRSNHLRNFKKLLGETDVKYPTTYSYLSPRVIKLGVRKYLSVGNITEADALTDRFIKLVEKIGMTRMNDQQTGSVTNFQNEEYATQFLNEIEKPTNHDYISIIDFHLYKKNISKAAQLISKYTEVPETTQEDVTFLILKTKLNMLKDFEKLRNIFAQNKGYVVPTSNIKMLEEAFENVVEKYNTDNPIFNDLLFDNVSALTKSVILTDFVENFVTQQCSGQWMKLDSVSRSKKFNGLLNILLGVGQEEKAYSILKKLEEALVKSKEDPNLLYNQFYSEVNAYHYAKFVEFYSLQIQNIKSQKVSLFDKKECKQKVKVLLERMQESEVIPNAVFLREILVFYDRSYDLNSCFEIINPLLDSKKEVSSEAALSASDPSHFYSRRIITKPLYYEIWSVYCHYYHILQNNSKIISKKSSIVKNLIKKQIKVHPSVHPRTLLQIMINDGEILPDKAFYKLIISTLMKSADLEAVPAVLTILSKKHDLDIDLDLSLYILKGLRRQYLRNISNTSKNAYDYKNRKMELMNNELLLKRIPQGMNQDAILSNLIMEILMFIKWKENVDYCSFMMVEDAFREFGIEPILLKGLIENVNKLKIKV
ncbi:sov1p [Saccharomyces arboricola H-6]|uniref:Sov1p n=1 Tax=Saccharomyces arboricola (strain H-6 / AS 2.3317 / CBS 10644) TaxID=1160507 RepID=J8LK20_SACAR|nr:sov1p [Saccharomyces arboricola H-6]